MAGGGGSLGVSATAAFASLARTRVPTNGDGFGRRRSDIGKD